MALRRHAAKGREFAKRTASCEPSRQARPSTARKSRGLSDRRRMLSYATGRLNAGTRVPLRTPGRPDVVVRQLREIRQQFASVIPLASVAKHVAPTVMRFPRTHGLPNARRHPMVMRSSRDTPRVCGMTVELRPHVDPPDSSGQKYDQRLRLGVGIAPEVLTSRGGLYPEPNS